MTIWIILFWVVGVVVLVAIAVWRGVKNGPTVFKSSSFESSSDIDGLRREQAHAEHRASKVADRTEEELKLLRSEIQKLSQKLEAQEKAPPKKASSDDLTALSISTIAALADISKSYQVYADDLCATVFKVESSGSVAKAGDARDLQLEIEALWKKYNHTGLGKYSFDPQRPKAPMVGLPYIAK